MPAARVHTAANVAWSGLRERISHIRGLTSDQSTGSGLFHSLCARVPWAISSLGPVSFLAGCYVAACLILWIGWTIFLPESETPFGGGPLHGLANLYFQFGKHFYGSAPIIVCWVVAGVAVRQRAKAVCSSGGIWPWIFRRCLHRKMGLFRLSPKLSFSARKPCFWRPSKTVSMITVSISSGRRRFTNLYPSRYFSTSPLLTPLQIEMQGSIARNYRCYATVRSFKKSGAGFVMDGEIGSDLRLQYTE